MKIQFYFAKTLLNIYASAPELDLCEKGSEKMSKIVPKWAIPLRAPERRQNIACKQLTCWGDVSSALRDPHGSNTDQFTVVWRVCSNFDRLAWDLAGKLIILFGSEITDSHNLTAFRANGKGHLWTVGIFWTSSCLIHLKFQKAANQLRYLFLNLPSKPINCIIYF